MTEMTHSCLSYLQFPINPSIVCPWIGIISIFWDQRRSPQSTHVIPQEGYVDLKELNMSRYMFSMIQATSGDMSFLSFNMGLKLERSPATPASRRATFLLDFMQKNPRSDMANSSSPLPFPPQENMQPKNGCFVAYKPWLTFLACAMSITTTELKALQITNSP